MIFIKFTELYNHPQSLVLGHVFIPKRSIMSLTNLDNEFHIRVIAILIQCLLWSELCSKQCKGTDSFNLYNDPEIGTVVSHLTEAKTETFVTSRNRKRQHLNSSMLTPKLLILASTPYCFLIYTGHLRSRTKIAITIYVLSLFHFISSTWSEKYSFSAKISIHLHTFPLSGWYWKYWKIMNKFIWKRMKLVSWQLSG